MFILNIYMYDGLWWNAVIMVLVQYNRKVTVIQEIFFVRGTFC